MSSLKQSAFKGVFWSAMDKIFSKAFSMVVFVILARLLMPEDFGLIGMLTIFIAVSQIVLDSGFTQALVQKHTPSQADLSTTFWFNIAVGFVLYAILYFYAPLIANFYETPPLSILLRVLGLSLMTSSSSVVQRARLLIKIDFKSIAIINIVSVILSSAVAIWAAYNNYGVWALVIQQILSQTLSTLLYWVLGKWTPSLIFSKESFKSLFKFGSKLLAAGFVSTFVTNLYNLVIGKIYHANELGFYTKARQLSEIVSLTVYEVLNSVTFPLLSSVKEDRERMVSMYSRMLSMTAFVILPTMTLMTVLAKPLVVGLLTEKWLPAVPFVQWLCMTRLFTPISSLNLSVLNAIGRSDLFLKLDLLKVPLTLGVMAITVNISIDAVVMGSFGVTFICYFMNAYLPGKLLGFGIVKQARIFYRIIISTMLSALCAATMLYIFDNVWAQLFIGGGIGLVSYYLVSLLLKIEEVKEVNEIIVKLLNR